MDCEASSLLLFCTYKSKGRERPDFKTLLPTFLLPGAVAYLPTHPSHPHPPLPGLYRVAMVAEVTAEDPRDVRMSVGSCKVEFISLISVLGVL